MHGRKELRPGDAYHVRVAAVLAAFHHMHVATAQLQPSLQRAKALAGAQHDAGPLSHAAAVCDTMTARELNDANVLRRAMRIHVYGTGVPAPVQSAEHMAESYALRPWLRRNILEAGT